jgi:hypothetical protein
MAIKAECLRKAGVINDQEKYWVDNRVCIFTRDAALKMQANSFFQHPLVAVILAAYEIDDTPPPKMIQSTTAATFTRLTGITTVPHL